MSPTETERTLDDLLFVGLNSKIIALDRYDGTMVWEWKSPKAANFLSLLLDGDRLMVAANGYVYCLDPLFGQEVWSNPLKGFGVGITSLASVRGQTGGGGAALRAKQAAAAAAASAGGTAAAT
jgi:outer membrane protein assembly factor BamB